jgi:hypothetical protein
MVFVVEGEGVMIYNNLAFFGVFIQDLLWGNWAMSVYYQYYLTFYINYDIK